MRRPAPALRFLLFVVGGWVCVRAAMLVPWGAEGEAGGPAMASVASRPSPGHPRPGGATVATVQGSPMRTAPAPLALLRRPQRPSLPASLRPGRILAPDAARPVAPLPSPASGTVLSLAAPPSLVLLGQADRQERPGRWSGSGWVHLRSGGSARALAGTLGGSQAGFRIGYRLNDDAARPLALSGRLYLPLDVPRAAEAALGLEWKPVASVPVRLLVEQRLDVGGRGRSDTALVVHGGVSARPLPLGLRLDAYAQAGMVGLEERDLFADGAMRLSAPLGSVELGAGAWGAAQPGAARLDVGPQMSVRLPLEGANVRLMADWRFRLAGDAAPASGPSLTLATDF